MARAIDVIVQSSPAEGWNMVTNARTKHTTPSQAQGTYPVGVVDAAQNHSGAAGNSSHGTGMNADIVATVIEAV